MSTYWRLNLFGSFRFAFGSAFGDCVSDARVAPSMPFLHYFGCQPSDVADDKICAFGYGTQ
eukprot:10172860-Lingulodinium_polyedra.AAC.1